MLLIKFKVTNDVIHRGILFPYLFNVYVDALSKQFQICNVRCSMTGHLINNIMYADDLVLI